MKTAIVIFEEKVYTFRFGDYASIGEVVTTINSVVPLRFYETMELTDELGKTPDPTSYPSYLKGQYGSFPDQIKYFGKKIVVQHKLSRIDSILMENIRNNV